MKANASGDLGCLIERLLSLVRSDKPLPCDCLRALQAQLVRNFDLEGGFLAIPLLGTSRISDGRSTIEAVPGDIVVVPNARAIDWEQLPDSEAGEYVAIGIHLDETLIASAQQLLPQTALHETGAIKAEPLTALLQPMLRWTEVMAQGRRALSLHAVVEVVIRLFEVGHLGLMRVAPPSIGSQIRAMVSADPEREWQSADFEERLHISGPTLRRRLAADGSSLRQLVSEARISHGLHLLLTTRMPIKAVAARVGYHSAASFSRRFAERYGVEPSQVGRN